MVTLAIDLGSSQFKGCLFKGIKPSTPIVSEPIQSQSTGSQVELSPESVDRCLANLLRAFSQKTKQVDRIIFANQSPSLTLISKNGSLLGPILTHLDRRSCNEAQFLERAIGKERWLKITGNRPYPGGIAATSLFWISRNFPTVFHRTHLFGCLNTFCLNLFTGKAAMDPANASFMGLYNTTSLKGWNDELCKLLGVDMDRLPKVCEASEIIGPMKKSLAKRFGFRSGIDVLVGTMDTSACALGVHLAAGDLLHVSGTSDVIATPMMQAVVSDQYLTRALGVGNRWLAVRTSAATGATIRWCRDIFGKIPRRKQSSKSKVEFTPYLAGDRLSLDPRTASLSGLTLSTNRDDILDAVWSSLILQSVDSMQCLAQVQSLTGIVFSTGGNRFFGKACHDSWRKKSSLPWRFNYVSDLGLKGLAKLASGQFR